MRTKKIIVLETVDDLAEYLKGHPEQYLVWDGTDNWYVSGTSENANETGELVESLSDDDTMISNAFARAGILLHIT